MPLSLHHISRLTAWLALAAAVTALALVACTSSFASPKLAAWADTLSPLTGHVLIGGVGALIAVAFTRQALSILAATVVVALAAHTGAFMLHQPTQPWPAAAPTPATTPGPKQDAGLRVYTHNVWDEHPDLQQLETALQAVEADVLVLIEVDPAKVPLLQRLAARYPYASSCAHRRGCATAVLSRFPILAGGADMASPHGRRDGPPIAWARIDASARGLGTVTVIGTHIHRPTRSPMLHVRQMQTLIGLIHTVKGPLIVAGDFNTSPWSASYRNLLEATQLEPAARLLPTWPMTPVSAPQFAIDHIFVSKDLAVARSGAAPATGSDHAPIFADITARQPLISVPVAMSNAAP
jgi:endonuclease/exonuclease/phosphatase (EEP) superfamily protein YafD